MQAVPLDFIVLAYPRSGTTWLANWLTTDRTLCLHDPFAAGMPHAWPSDRRARGISCTVSAMLPAWIAQYLCPVVVIHRDRRDCNRSLKAAGLPKAPIAESALQGIRALHFDFDDIWIESEAQKLWAHLLPYVPFDALRYRMLRDIQVQPHMGKFKVDPVTISALIDSGELRLGS